MSNTFVTVFVIFVIFVITIQLVVNNNTAVHCLFMVVHSALTNSNKILMLKLTLTKIN